MCNFGQSFSRVTDSAASGIQKNAGEHLLLLLLFIWEQTQQENSDLRAALSHCLV